MNIKMALEQQHITIMQKIKQTVTNHFKLYDTYLQFKRYIARNMSSMLHVINVIPQKDEK